MDVEQLLARRQVSLPPPNLVAAPLESFWADLFCTSAERQPPAATPTSVEELRVDLEESVRQIYEARRHPDLSQHNALWQQLQQVQKSVTSEVESSQQQILQMRVKCSELEAHVQRAEGAFSRECQVSAALRDENAVLRREILQANTKAQLLSDKALLAESSSQSLRIENQQLHRFLQYTLKHATALREALDKSEESQRKVVEHFMSQLEVMRAKDMKLFMERETSLTSQFNASMHEVASCLQDTMLQREEGTTSRWNDRLDAFKVSVSASVKAVTQATDVVDRKVSSTLAQVEKSQKHMSDEQRVQLGQFLNAMNDRDNALQQRFQLMQNQHVEQLAKWSLLMDELQATYKHREARVERECVERLERQEEQFNRERDAMRSSHLQQLGEISQSHVQNEKELERHHRQIERELLESFRSTMRSAQHVAKQAEPSLTVSSSSDLLRKVQALEGRQRERADQLRGSVVDVSPDRGSAAPS